MKCANCGGNYRTRELICPYCNTENAIGRIWKAQRTEAELEYEKARKEMGLKASPYVIDRILSRVMLIMCLIGIVALFIVALVSFGRGFYIGYYQTHNKEEITRTLETYLQERNFIEMEAYMDKYDLYFSEETYYEYRQAAIMYRTYQDYMMKKMVFLELSDAEMKEDNYDCFELQSVLKNSSDVYCVEMGIYDELHEKNREMWEEYSSEIMIFWKATLGLTEEEIAKLTDESAYVTMHFDNELLKSIIERRAWDVQ